MILAAKVGSVSILSRMFSILAVDGVTESDPDFPFFLKATV